MSNDVHEDTDSQKIAKREQETLKEIAKVLNDIAKKYPAITEQEAGFVRAREDYLTEKQVRVFSDLFKAKEVKNKKEPVVKAEN